MGMSLNKPLQRLWNPAVTVFLALVVCFVSAVPVAYAQPTSFTADIQNNATLAIALMLQLMQVLTWVLFSFLNYLLDPRFFLDLSNDGTSGLMDMLNEIWQLSRDLMNIIFAVALVFTAIYTVITAQKDFVSQNAKRFVMAVVLVNFSWFIPQVFLDLSSVATATIYGIPSLLADTNADTSCQLAGGGDCVTITNVKFLNDDKTAANLQGNGWSCQLSNFVCYKKELLNAETVSTQSAILSGLIINHARLTQLAKATRPISSTGAKAGQELLVFFVRESIILLITIALFFPLLAMVVAFTIRIPVLWITMAFMPFALLDWVVPNEQIHQGIPAKIRDQFIKAAFLPAFVAVPLTVGFILINAGAKATGGGLQNIPFPIMATVGSFWEILWLLISLTVLYTGVFGVLKKQDGILATGAGAIQNFGTTLGKLAVSVPLSKEFIPTVTGGLVKTSPLPLLNNLNPNRLLQNLRATGSLDEAIRGRTPDGERALDTTSGALRENRDALRTLNASIDRLGRANDADFGREAEAIRTQLRSRGLTVGTDAQLAEALRGLRVRTPDLVVPEAVLNRLNRPPAGATPAPAPAPTPTPGGTI